MTSPKDKEERDARLRAACVEFRDCVLFGRHQLEEPCLDSDQTNAVLSLFDDVIGGPLFDFAPAPKE